MDKIEKLLRKQPRAIQAKLLSVIANILAGKLSGYDIVKLAGEENLYRIRKGDFRIIFEIKNGKYGIVRVSRRGDHTYNF